MHRRAVLFSIFAGIGLAGVYALSTAQSEAGEAGITEDEGRAGTVTMTDRNGKPFPSSSPGPITLEERMQRKQVETPEQVGKRNDYVERLKQTLPPID